MARFKRKTNKAFTVLPQSMATRWPKLVPTLLFSSIFMAFPVVSVMSSTLSPTTAALPSTVNLQQDGRIAELQVVDCLLPGMMRRLGMTQYLTPRRPIKTTAADCNTRGGEYTSYDRSDYKTALSIWMPAAEAGGADAQTNVGEIYERGLGGAPNYVAAALWYEKAAQQGNARAQFNLGTLYEQGLGVEQSRLQALNWYRQAWGVPEDNLIFQSAANSEIAELKARLKSDVDLREGRIYKLEADINDLKAKIESQRQQQKIPQKTDAGIESNRSQDDQNIAIADATQLEKEVYSLERWVTSLETENRQTLAQLDELPQLREPVTSNVKQHEGRPNTMAEVVKAEGLEFGRYHALVIGNQDYSNLDDLVTPLNDAQKMSTLLEEKYGFSVQTLLDASNIEIMEAINNLKDNLGEDDNLLIYYAGHGNRIQSGNDLSGKANGYESGYWLPVNADAPPRDTYWVSNEFITRHLSRLDVKRILIVADSCYAGMLSEAPEYLMLGDQQNNPEFLKYKLPKRSRLLLSSGGNSPVLDQGAPAHSVFAAVLLETLENNEDILSGPELFSRIKDSVQERAKQVGFEQKPEFKVIKGAGHEVGDFFFVPRKS